MAEIFPRQAEVDALMEVLTDTTYDGPQEMAKDLLKVAYNKFRERDWWAFGVVYHGKPAQVYGLEPTEQKAWEAARDLTYRDRAVWPILSYDKFVANREVAVVDAEFVPNPNCVKCGHQEWSHVWVDWQGKRTFPKKAESAPKCSTDCSCTGFIGEAQKEREDELEADHQRRQERLKAVAARETEKLAAKPPRKTRAKKAA